MSLTDRLEQFFRSQPNRWIDGTRLASIGGVYAWRTRCSNLRKRGLQIENRQRKVRDKIKSEYRFYEKPVGASPRRA